LRRGLNNSAVFLTRCLTSHRTAGLSACRMFRDVTETKMTEERWEGGESWVLLIQLDRTMIDARRLSSHVSLTDDNTTARRSTLIGASVSELHARAGHDSPPLPDRPTGLFVLSRCLTQRPDHLPRPASPPRCPVSWPLIPPARRKLNFLSSKLV